MYFVGWVDDWRIRYSDIIYAKDSVKAWAKIKRKHPFTARKIEFIKQIEE
jgi:hypothetical protein